MIDKGLSNKPLPKLQPIKMAEGGNVPAEPFRREGVEYIDDGSGNMVSADASAALKQTVGLSDQDLRYDVDGSGEVNLQDALAFMKYASGQDVDANTPFFSEFYGASSQQPENNFDAFNFKPKFTNPDGSIVFEGKGGITTVAPDLATANQQYLDRITSELTSDVSALQGTDGVDPYIGERLKGIQATGDLYQSVTGNKFEGLGEAISAFRKGDVAAYNAPAFPDAGPPPPAADGPTFGGTITDDNVALVDPGGPMSVDPPINPPIMKPDLPVTKALGEEGTTLPELTTMAAGEEDGGFPGGEATTMAMGEEDGGFNPIDEVTTTAIGEEGDAPPFMDEPPLYTTMAMGEEDGGGGVTPIDTLPQPEPVAPIEPFPGPRPDNPFFDLPIPIDNPIDTMPPVVAPDPRTYGNYTPPAAPVMGAGDQRTYGTTVPAGYNFTPAPSLVSAPAVDATAALDPLREGLGSFLQGGSANYLQSSGPRTSVFTRS
jgi:hypothetical protein